MIEKKIFEIIIANDGTLTSVPNIALKQNENNSIFRIKTDALSDGGIIKLNFIKADDTDYAVQYATLSDNGVHEWNLQEYLTSVAPYSANEIKLSITAIDYDEVIFTTLPITIALTQTNSYSPSVTNENTTDALAHDLNEVIKEVINDKQDLVEQDKKIDTKLDKDILKYNVATVFVDNDWILFERNGEWYKYPANSLSGGSSGGQCSLYDRGTYLTLEIANETITDGKLGDYVTINAKDSAPLLALWDIDTGKFELSGSGIYVSAEEFTAYADAWNLEKQEIVNRIDSLENEKLVSFLEQTSEFITKEVETNDGTASVLELKGSTKTSDNLFDQETLVSLGFTKNSDDSYFINTPASITDKDFYVGDFKYLKIKGYTSTGSNGFRLTVKFVDGTSENIDFPSTSFIEREFVSEKEIEKVVTSWGNNLPTTITDIIISNTDIPYTSYGFKHTQLNVLNSIDDEGNIIDTINYGLGDFIDGDSIVGNVLTKTYGNVDMGNLEWTYTSSTQLFETTIPTKAKGNFNLFTSKYNTDTTGSWSTMVDMTIKGNGNDTQILVKDSDYTNATNFKASLSGQILYYELATPIVTALDIPTNIQVKNNGNLTFTDTTLPIISTFSYPTNTSSEVTRLSSLVNKLDNEIAKLNSGSKVEDLTSELELSTAIDSFRSMSLKRNGNIYMLDLSILASATLGRINWGNVVPSAYMNVGGVNVPLLNNVGSKIGYARISSAGNIDLLIESSINVVGYASLMWLK